MSSGVFKFLAPWKHRRVAAERLVALRARDGDNCARCRRPMRFDLPAGHEQSVVVEEVAAGDLRLCHPRCNQPGLDLTGEVTERVKRKNEAALFANSRKRQKKAA